MLGACGYAFAATDAIFGSDYSGMPVPKERYLSQHIARTCLDAFPTRDASVERAYFDKFGSRYPTANLSFHSVCHFVAKLQPERQAELVSVGRNLYYSRFLRYCVGDTPVSFLKSFEK